MRFGHFALLATAAAVTLPHPADAWMHSGHYGSASGGHGSWSASGYRGGSASGGDGSWSAKGAWGGSASGGDGSWSAHGAYGGSASGGDGSWHAEAGDGATAYGGYDHPTTVYGGYPHAYGGTYYGGYHPPTTVDTYNNTCENCGGWSGGAVAAAGALGLAAGAAVGTAAAAGSAAATNTAYAEGVAAGEATSAPRPAVYTTLPSNCAYKPVGTANDFDCGNGMWLQPAYGANGLYYHQIPPPG
jgi:hypothetical protein